MAFDYTKLSRPKQRATVLVRTRNLKMARNAHAYVRGSTVKFYEWLEEGGRKLPPGPSVWICGDCHLGNLGQLAEERIENMKPSIPLGRRFWALTKSERRALKELLESDSARELITALKGRREDDRIEVLDAAYWMKGCSSLGRLRYAVLVGVADGEPASNNLCLIDIKEGVLAAAPRAPDAKMPRDNAER